MIIRMPRINRKPKAIPMLNFKDLENEHDDWHVHFIGDQQDALGQRELYAAGLVENQYALAEKRILAQAESMAAAYPALKAITTVGSHVHQINQAPPARSNHQVGIAQDNHLTSKMGERKRLMDELVGEDFTTKAPVRPSLTEDQIKAIVQKEMLSMAPGIEAKIAKNISEMVQVAFDAMLKELVVDLKLTVGTLSDQVDEIWEELRDGA